MILEKYGTLDNIPSAHCVRRGRVWSWFRRPSYSQVISRRGAGVSWKGAGVSWRGAEGVGGRSREGLSPGKGVIARLKPLLRPPPLPGPRGPRVAARAHSLYDTINVTLGVMQRAVRAALYTLSALLCLRLTITTARDFTRERGGPPRAISLPARQS